MTEINFQDIWNRAVAKGKEEASSHKETMHVWLDGDGTKHIHGACGFARVVLNDGRSSFAKWAKKNANFDRGYYGIQFYVSDYGQSYELKDKFASTVARELKANGIYATHVSTLD